MEKLMRQMEKNIKNQEKAFRASERLLSRQVKENAKLEKENMKLMKVVNKQKINAVNQKFIATQRSFKMKFMNQNKKIAKILGEIKANQKALEVNNDVIMEITLYKLKEVARRTYKDRDVKTDSEGTRYILGLQLHGVRILGSKVASYEAGNFYNEHDDGYVFIQDFVALIKTVGEYENNMITQLQQSDDFNGFMISHKEIVNKNTAHVNFLNQNYMAGDENKKINTPYTSYQVNLQATDFKDLLVLHHHEYVKTNFRPYSCLLTAVINKFYDRFNRIKADGKRRNRELTYSYLCELLEIPDMPSHNAVSIQTVVDKFFKRFTFASLYVYSPYMTLLYKHDAEVAEGVMALRVIVKDKHIYEINDNVKQLQQMVNYEDDERAKLKVSDKYRIIERQESKEVYCADIDEIFITIKESAEIEELTQLTIITPSSLVDALVKIIASGYTPKVFFSTFLYKFSIFTKTLNIFIETCDNNPMYGESVAFENLTEYQAYNVAYEQMYKSIIKKEFISEYHDSVTTIEDTYKIRPILGNFDEKMINRPFCTLDENKAYTECLMSMTSIPVFHYFDVYHPYDNHAIEDLTYYIVDVLEESVGSAILFDSKITRTFGYVLKASNIKHKVIYYRRPLKIDTVDFKTPINKLYEDVSVSVNMKKLIVNKITGMLELKTNRSHLTKIFEDFNEANHYSIKYNGKIIPVVTDIFDEKKQFSSIDDCFAKTFITGNKTHYYLVNVKEEKRLTNGLCPIKDMVYLSQRLKMFNLYNKMVKAGLTVVGCKTDCLFYFGSDKLITSEFLLGKNIGEFKIETGKYLPNKKMILESNELITITDYNKVNLKTFDDEKDTVTINKYIDSKKRLLVKGEYPGVGKSTMCKKYDDDSLFILPYNKLCQNLKTEGYDAITYSRAFGLYKDDVELKNIKQHDLSSFNTIVFDEALLYTPDRLKRLDKLISMYPEKTFMSTGDTDQRNPIGFENEAYLQLCMNIIFRDQVLLKDIKRLVDPKDIQRWKDLKVDVFNNKMTVNEICKKHKLNTVTSMNDVKTTNNICYFNFRCDIVNNHVHRNILKKDVEHYEGLKVICRKYEKLKAGTLYTNYEYKIKKIGTDITITDEVENIDYRISKTMLCTHFKLPYGLTCDSVQGLSFGEDEKITVFDSNLPYTDRKYLWTAITRARKLDNVYIYVHSDLEVERFTDSKIKQYFRFKVENYKAQDKKASRVWEEKEYITESWINKQIELKGTYCPYCKTNMELYVSESNTVVSNVTVDRLDNGKSHIQDNCHLCCLACNVKKGAH